MRKEYWQELKETLAREARTSLSLVESVMVCHGKHLSWWRSCKCGSRTAALQTNSSHKA